MNLQARIEKLESQTLVAPRIKIVVHFKPSKGAATGVKQLGGGSIPLEQGEELPDLLARCGEGVYLVEE